MAYEIVCKQSLLYEGELIPCMVGDHESVIMWPDGGKPKAYEARCPHEAVSLGRESFTPTHSPSSDVGLGVTVLT